MHLHSLFPRHTKVCICIACSHVALRYASTQLRFKFTIPTMMFPRRPVSGYDHAYDTPPELAILQDVAPHVEQLSLECKLVSSYALMLSIMRCSIIIRCSLTMLVASCTFNLHCNQKQLIVENCLSNPSGETFSTV